jgi:hypothetical protein
METRNEETSDVAIFYSIRWGTCRVVLINRSSRDDAGMQRQVQIRKGRRLAERHELERFP